MNTIKEVEVYKAGVCIGIQQNSCCFMFLRQNGTVQCSVTISILWQVHIQQMFIGKTVCACVCVCCLCVCVCVSVSVLCLCAYGCACKYCMCLYISLCTHTCSVSLTAGYCTSVLNSSLHPLDAAMTTGVLPLESFGFGSAPCCNSKSAHFGSSLKKHQYKFIIMLNHHQITLSWFCKTLHLSQS